MIVKTGANYQAEGGYIEASHDGYIITIDGKEYNTKNGLFPVGLLNIVNESATQIGVYAGQDGDANTAPVYYVRAVAAESQRQFQAFYPGLLYVTIPATVSFDSARSIGCEMTNGALRVFADNATAYFM